MFLLLGCVKEKGDLDLAIETLKNCHVSIIKDKDSDINSCFCDGLDQVQIETMSEMFFKYPTEQEVNIRFTNPQQSVKDSKVTIFFGGYILHLNYENQQWCIESVYWK